MQVKITFPNRIIFNRDHLSSKVDAGQNNINKARIEKGLSSYFAAAFCMLSNRYEIIYQLVIKNSQNEKAFFMTFFLQFLRIKLNRSFQLDKLMLQVKATLKSLRLRKGEFIIVYIVLTKLYDVCRPAVWQATILISFSI